MPSPGFPGVDWSCGYHASFAVDDGLEGPSHGGVVSVEDCFGGCFDLGCAVPPERGDEALVWNRLAAQLDEKFFELLLVEWVGVGVNCSCCCGPGFEDCSCEGGWLVGIVEEMVTNLRMLISLEGCKGRWAYGHMGI